MAISIKTLTALAALLVAAPGATALGGIANASSPLLPEADADSLGDVGVDVVPRGGSDVVSSTIDAAHAAVADAGQLATCELAVPVHARWYTGQVTDRRTTEGEWLVRHAWRWTTQEQVKVITEVTTRAEAAADTLGLASALEGKADLPLVTETLAPVTERLVTYTTVTRNHHMAGDALVRGTIREVYITWTEHEADWFVSPFGFVPDGYSAGKTQLVCGETVLGNAPYQRGERVCICDERPQDGWRYAGHRVAAELADGRVYHAHRTYSHLSDVGAALADDARAALDALPVSERDLARQDAERDAAWSPEGAAPASAGDARLASAGATAAAAAAGTGAALMLGLVALAAFAARRRS